MKQIFLRLITVLAVILPKQVWAQDTVINYSFDNEDSPILTIGSRSTVDYSKTSVATDSPFLTIAGENNTTGATDVVLTCDIDDNSSWILEFFMAFYNGCNNREGSAKLTAGEIELFSINNPCNWGSTVNISFSSQTSTLVCYPCNRDSRGNAEAMGTVMNDAAYWYKFTLTGSPKNGVHLTIDLALDQTQETMVANNVLLSETNVIPSLLSLSPGSMGGIAIDNLTLTVADRTEPVTAFSSPSFTVTLNPNRGTAQWFTNYYRLGNGGSLTLTGKSNVDKIVNVKMNLQDPARSGSGVRVSSGTLVGDSIIDVNATTLTITSTDNWPQLWLTSLDVTYEGSAPQGTYAILLPQYQTNGTVTSSMDWADEGDVVTLTATPDEGYHLARLYANQGTVTLSPSAEAADQYTFTMPAEDVTVRAQFDEGDITTGVLLNVPEDSEAHNTPIYNLQGQRLQRLQRGINIVGGRKKLIQ